MNRIFGERRAYQSKHCFSRLAPAPAAAAVTLAYAVATANGGKTAPCANTGLKNTQKKAPSQDGAFSKTNDFCPSDQLKTKIHW
jgi:hypothetical protein